jgi:hypothetical protein
MENSFSPRLIAKGEAAVVRGGLEFGVRLPWYRSLPLSVVEVGELKVDGAPVPAERVRFDLNGRSFTLAQLPEQTGEVWYILDSARLRVDGQFDAARDHEIVLTLNIYPPYVPGLTWVTRGSLALPAL